MRITALGVTEFLSFEGLELDGLAPGLTVVVGPNGTGKSNLVRVLDLARTALERVDTFSDEAYRTLLLYAQARRLGADPSNRSAVRIGVELTEDWERELMVGFLRGVVASGLLQGAATNADISEVAQWVDQQVDSTTLAPLLGGEIVIGLPEDPTEPWDVAYEFRHADQVYRWILDGMPTKGAIVRMGDARVDGQVRTVAERLGVGEKRPAVPTGRFELSRLFPPASEATSGLLEWRVSGVPAWLRKFASLAEAPVEELPRRSYSLARVFNLILHRGLILSRDLRLPPQREYELQELGSEPELEDASEVPLELFRLKNGDATKRARYRETQRLFQLLTGGFHFDVESTPIQSAPAAAEQRSRLRISPVVPRQGRDLPIEFCGAGIWEALVLSTLIAESSGRVVVLDEPALNLHPTLQRRLLSRLGTSPGQFLIITHSPYLVPSRNAEDLARLVRFDMRDGATRAWRLEANERDVQAARWVKELSESADARALLFAAGVVLVEGGTELGALPVWFDKSQKAIEGHSPEALNLAIFSVEGDSNFGAFVAFLHRFGVPWVIVCDGAAFRFDRPRTPQIFQQLLDAGVESEELRDVVAGNVAGRTTDFKELKAAGERHGLFTLANDRDVGAEAFEAFIEQVAPGKFGEAEKAVGASKPRRGRYVAYSTACPPELDALYASILTHLGLSLGA